METACSRFSFLKILRQSIWTPFSIMLHNDISNFWESAIFLQTKSHQKMYIQVIAESNLIYSISRFHSLFSTNFSNKWARAPSQKLHEKTLFLWPNSSLGNLSCFANFLSESKIWTRIPWSNTLKIWKNWFEKNITAQNIQFLTLLAQRELHHHVPHRILTSSGQKIILIWSTIAVLWCIEVRVSRQSCAETIRLNAGPPPPPPLTLKETKLFSPPNIQNHWFLASLSLSHLRGWSFLTLQ